MGVTMHNMFWGALQVLASVVMSKLRFGMGPDAGPEDLVGDFRSNLTTHGEVGRPLVD